MSLTNSLGEETGDLMLFAERYTTADGSTLYPTNEENWVLDERTFPFFRVGVGILNLTGVTKSTSFKLRFGGAPFAQTTVIPTQPIGTSTTDSFVRSPDRRGYRRVVCMDGVPGTSSLVINVRPCWLRDSEGQIMNQIQGVFEIVTVYPGIVIPREPCDTRPGSSARAGSTQFWCQHAWVYTPEMGGITHSDWREILDRHDADS